MTLPSLLSRARSDLLDSWVERTIASYPAPQAGRIRRERDPFLNPVGSTLRRELEQILDGVIEGKEAEELSSHLEGIVRIRAVQDFQPSAAVAFLFDLKTIVEETVAKGPETVDPGELRRLDRSIDGLARHAFDQYVACREKVFDIRVNEIRNQTHRALQRAGILGHDPEPPSCGPRASDTERGRPS
jgi:hypothetical protein